MIQVSVAAAEEEALALRIEVGLTRQGRRTRKGGNAGCDVICTLCRAIGLESYSKNNKGEDDNSTIISLNWHSLGPDAASHHVSFFVEPLTLVFHVLCT